MRWVTALTPPPDDETDDDDATAELERTGTGGRQTAGWSARTANSLSCRRKPASCSSAWSCRVRLRRHRWSPDNTLYILTDGGELLAYR